MSGDIGVYVAEDGGVYDHHGAGDSGHAAGHQAKELALGEARDIGANQERGFGHAEKDIGRHADAFGRTDAHQLLHDTAEPGDEPRQDAVVVENARERGDEN